MNNFPEHMQEPEPAQSIPLEQKPVGAESTDRAAEMPPEPQEAETVAIAEKESEAEGDQRPEQASAEKNGPENKAKRDSQREKKKETGKRPSRSVGFIALPVGVSQLIKKYGVSHPGLVLNKYAVLLKLQDRRLQYDFSSDQKKRILQKVAHLLSSEAELRQEWEKQKAQRDDLIDDARQLSFTSLSPTVFESYHPFATLGVDLHELYGFPIIPAAAIKGALKQYLQEQWLPQQADRDHAQALIHQVFGLPKTGEGDILFHDAWPEQWPSLAVEQVANHHAPYYRRRENPGDWQIPETESFLVLKPGSRFQIAFSARRPDLDKALLQQLEDWLQALMQKQGLGAYRQLGYGRWKGGQKLSSQNDWEGLLSLSSPAFLAGATQRPEDCRLRASTLRGLLRWWWRTLHSGYLGHRELEKLESVIWGGRQRKGAVKMVLTPEKDVQSRRYRPEEILQRLPQAEGPRRSPGLVYLGYGFFSDHAKRYFIDSGASWKLELQVDSAHWSRKEGDVHFSKEQILQQVHSALWLLTHFGGVGQRKRKGFGALQLQQPLELSLEQCQAWAASLRRSAELPEQFSHDLALSPALEQALDLFEIQTPWKNVWFALHQMGESIQSYMQAHKHEASKGALGLPRVMAPPVNGEFKTPEQVGQRHAAPYFLKLEQSEAGLIIRALAFPAAQLPNLSESKALLEAFVAHLRRDLQARVEQWATEPDLSVNSEQGRRKRGDEESPRKRQNRRERGEQKAPRGERSRRDGRSERPRRSGGDREWPPRDGGERRGSGGRPPQQRKRNQNGLPQAGDWVSATLLEERTKKGGWRAEHTRLKLSGPVVNTALVPGDKAPGENLELIVHAVNKLEMIFRWPTEAEREKREKGAQGQRSKGQKKRK